MSLRGEPNALPTLPRAGCQHPRFRGNSSTASLAPPTVWNPAANRSWVSDSLPLGTERFYRLQPWRGIPCQPHRIPAFGDTAPRAGVLVWTSIRQTTE